MFVVIGLGQNGIPESSNSPKIGPREMKPWFSGDLYISSLGGPGQGLSGNRYVDTFYWGPRGYWDDMLGYMTG